MTIALIVTPTSNDWATLVGNATSAGVESGVAIVVAALTPHCPPAQIWQRACPPEPVEAQVMVAITIPPYDPAAVAVGKAAVVLMTVPAAFFTSNFRFRVVAVAPRTKVKNPMNASVYPDANPAVTPDAIENATLFRLVEADTV